MALKAYSQLQDLLLALSINSVNRVKNFYAITVVGLVHIGILGLGL